MNKEDVTLSDVRPKCSVIARISGTSHGKIYRNGNTVVVPRGWSAGRKEAEFPFRSSKRILWADSGDASTSVRVDSVPLNRVLKNSQFCAECILP